jgi:hypothetical protein
VDSQKRNVTELRIFENDAGQAVDNYKTGCLSSREATSVEKYHTRTRAPKHKRYQEQENDRNDKKSYISGFLAFAAHDKDFLN